MLVAVEEQVAAEVAAGEARHQAGDDAEQGRLPRPGRAGHEHQLAVPDREVDVAEDGLVVVGDGDAAELDHVAIANRGSGATGAATSPIVAATRAAADRDGQEVSGG